MYDDWDGRNGTGLGWSGLDFAAVQRSVYG